MEPCNSVRSDLCIEREPKLIILVQNEAHDEHPSLVLVTKDRLPRQTVYRLETKNIIVPHRYYLLLWLPLTIPVDAATLPLQILAYPFFKSINC